MERPQTILVLAPMYHANGFSTLYTLLGGDTLVIMEKFDAARVVDVIERHRVSTFTATPTMLQRIADLPGIDDTRSLEHRLDPARRGADAAIARAPLDLVASVRNASSWRTA